MRAPPVARYLRLRLRKSRKSGTLLTGIIIPATVSGRVLALDPRDPAVPLPDFRSNGKAARGDLANGIFIVVRVDPFGLAYVAGIVEPVMPIRRQFRALPQVATIIAVCGKLIHPDYLSMRLRLLESNIFCERNGAVT